MNQITKHVSNGAELVERVVVQGDLSKLTPAERTAYYSKVCESLGLNPLTKPFEYITLNGKLTLYARKDATEQLRALRGISLKIVAREKVEDVYLVTAQAQDKQGRTDESIGAVNVGGLKGDALANAVMKAETKAKRRVTLSISGLGMLEESELETIPAEAKQPQGRGNPLRQEFAALSYELDACKSIEQIDLLLNSPEFLDFEARDAQQTSGMSFAGMMRDKAEQMRKKLPERIRYEGNRIVATTDAEAEFANGGRPADVAADQSGAAPPSSNSADPPPSEFSAIAVQCMEQFDVVDDADGFKAAQKFAMEHQRELTADEKKALNELSRRVGARLRESA